ncbi:hypothetical protein OG481_02100 [Streptomyces longwoodensis]|uniref:hypothetical protein n=1 Tax=Streptomyces longwoodensis TaxID=68231 RepID=UPI002DDA7383|nr:hypothetical protein [Streptomyces longwoodensis]WRY87385.1 hypothetical protein OG481_02100 [Streptomyces longwoodensis]
MITDLYVQEADPAPVAFAFRQMGGFNGEVTVSVLDAEGITHVPSRDDMRHPDTGFLLEIQVRLDPGWAYPARVMVDWAEEHPMSSKETTA